MRLNIWRNGASLEILRRTRRIIIIVIGMTVLLFGLTLIVLPGPAIIVIPVGLTILGSEVAWARHVLNKVKTGKDKIGNLINEKYDKNNLEK